MKFKIYQPVFKNRKLFKGDVFEEYLVWDNDKRFWEFYQFKLFFDKKEYLKHDYFGVVSGKFEIKTQVSREAFEKFLVNNPGYDLYFINPFDFMHIIYDNPWEQGEVCHPGLIDLVMALFERVGYSTELIFKTYPVDVLSYCNYFVGNQLFWEKYMDFAMPVFDELSVMFEEDESLQNFNSYLSGECNLFPFVFERLLSTFLFSEGRNLRIKKYTYSPEEINLQLKNYAKPIIESHFNLSRKGGLK